MAHGQGLDLGNVLQQVESIRGQRSINAINQQTLSANALAQDVASQQNVLLQQFLAGDTAAFNQLAPETQSQILSNQTAQQGLTTGQQGIEQRNAEVAFAGTSAILKSAAPKTFAKTALPEMIKQLEANGINVDDLSDDEFRTMVQGMNDEAKIIATAGQDPQLPLSPEGKKAFDVRQRFLTAEEAAETDEAVTFSSVTQNPDGSTTGISSKTGQLEIIPSSVVGVQNIRQVDAINKLITEAKKDKRVDNFITVSSNFDRVDSASPNAAGDLALVFSFMKMLDPGSVVREGEQALARNAAGVPERIRTTYNNILEGASLSSSQRKQFKAEAGKVFTASRNTAEKAVAPIVNQAKRLNLRAETINEVVFGLPEAVALEAPPQFQEGQTATGPNNVKIIFRNGQWETL